MSNNDNNFDKFLLKEYSNISQAHFKSIETISTFFRYYLLIMSIPISAFAIFSQIAPNKDPLLYIILQYKILIFIVLSSISIIGLFVFLYITNLRLDTMLYARVINGIRKKFYDEYEIDLNLDLVSKLRDRVTTRYIEHYTGQGLFFD